MAPFTVTPFDRSRAPDLQAFRETLGLREHRLFLDQLEAGLAHCWLATDGTGRVRAYSMVRPWPRQAPARIDRRVSRVRLPPLRMSPTFLPPMAPPSLRAPARGAAPAPSATWWACSR